MQVLPHGFILVLVGTLGLIFGSFITALSYRLPRSESIAHGRSHCSSCNTTLTVRDLVPVISWILSGGRCRHCGAPVSWRYPVIEALMLILFVIAALEVSRPVPLALVLAMTVTMMALAVIDLEHWVLPNGLLGLLAALAVAWRWVNDGDFVSALVQAGALFAVGFVTNLVAGRLTRRPGFGMGDTKLLALAGVALPLGPLVLTLALATSVGFITGIIWLKRTGSVVFPFGPSILASLWIGQLFGEPILRALIAAF